MDRSLPVALLLLLGSPPTATAAPQYHTGHAVYGCVDPRATRALASRDGDARPYGWAASVRQQGRCYLLRPALHLDIILNEAELVLLRRVPPQVGEPPLYVMNRDVAVMQTDRNDVPRVVPVAPKPDVPPSGPSLALAPDEQPVQFAPAVQPPMLAGSADGRSGRPGVVAQPASHATVTPAPIDPDQTAPDRPSASDAAPPAIASVDPIPSATPNGAITSIRQPDAAAPDNAGATAIARDRASAPWPPQSTLVTANRRQAAILVAAIVTLLLLLFVAAALLLARRRRRFSLIDDGWTARTEGSASDLLMPITLPFLTPLEFHRRCAEMLEGAGWTMHLAFPGTGGGPDITGRRDGVLLVVRCRLSRTAISGEMVDEAAAMGARQVGAMTMLVSNAPFSQRARDEGIRQGIHLMRDTELAAFIG